jgi:dienelactone hydrolase
MKTLLCFVGALALAALACHKDAFPDDATKPGLAFESFPAAASLNGRFQVTVRLNDARGALARSDSFTQVTIQAAGNGALHGTLARSAIDGRVVFDDLSYDTWEAIHLTVTAVGYPDATAHAPLPVSPILRFAGTPIDRLLAGEPAGPYVIELVDGRGRAVQSSQSVHLETAGITVGGGPERAFAGGPVTFESIGFSAPGAKTLVWTSPGVPELALAVTVYAGQQEERRWLPAARVDLPYRAVLPAQGAQVRLLRGTLPKGLKLEAHGELHGVPEVSEHTRFEIIATPATGAPTLWRAELSVFPAHEVALAPIDTLDADGPFEVASLDETMPVPARKTTALVRTLYPAHAGQVAEGVFPLVVFHHGAALYDPSHPQLYDRYDHLLRRWASHGFVVATVDGQDLVWLQGRLLEGTLANLTAMSENQRAAIAFLRGRNADPASPLAGHIDVDRVIVAGHSRGAGASLITARAEPSVVGGVLIKPLDPMTGAGGEVAWQGALPAKPFLMLVAGDDGDVPYPMVDYLYERRAGPMASVTILGSDHFFSCDEACKPEDTSVPTITREEDWAVTNAYAVAFLRYVGLGEMEHAQRLFGATGLTTKLSTGGVLVQSDRRADAVLVDDFQDEVAGRNSLGLGDADSGMTLSEDAPSLLLAMRMLPTPYLEVYASNYERPAVLALSNAHHLQWQQDHAAYHTTLGGLDVRGRQAFVMRVRSDSGALDGGRMQLVFHDSADHTATVIATGHTGAAAIGARFSDVIVPLAELTAAGVDLETLASIDLMLDGAGGLFLDDLRFE